MHVLVAWFLDLVGEWFPPKHDSTPLKGWQPQEYDRSGWEGPTFQGRFRR